MLICRYYLNAKSFAVRHFCGKKQFSQKSLLFSKTYVPNTTTACTAKLDKAYKTDLVLTVYKMFLHFIHNLKSWNMKISTVNFTYKGCVFIIQSKNNYSTKVSYFQNSARLSQVLKSAEKSWNLLIFMKNPGRVLEFYTRFVRWIFFSKKFIMRSRQVVM